MRITCHAIEPDGGLRIIEEETALAAWREGQGPFWIGCVDMHFHQFIPADHSQVGAQFGEALPYVGYVFDDSCEDELCAIWVIP